MIFKFLVTIVDAIDKTWNAEDEEIGTEETNEGVDVERAGIQNNDAHNSAANTGENPDKAISRVNGGTETDDDFGDATNDSVGGNGD